MTRQQATALLRLVHFDVVCHTAWVDVLLLLTTSVFANVHCCAVGPYWCNACLAVRLKPNSQGNPRVTQALAEGSNLAAPPDSKQQRRRAAFWPNVEA